MLAKLFAIAFFLNLLYEILHSLLYATCWQASLRQYVYLMLKASLFDACAIVILYVVSAGSLLVFIAASLAFAYAWEIYSLKNKKWEYLPTMPKVLGVGLTPLVQLAVLGIISICAATKF